MSSMKTVSIVVPVFRNEATLETLYQNVTNVFIGLPKFQLELLFVDDGSDDGSLEIIHQISERDSRVRYLSFDKNYGQVAAIVAGLRHCIGDASVVMSADLQDPINKIEEMIECWKAGVSIVICYRTAREDKWIDRVFSFIFYSLIKLIYYEIPSGGFDYFLLDRLAIDQFNTIKKPRRFLQGDVIKLKGMKIFIPYKRLSREAGKSQWTFKRKCIYALNALSYFKIYLLKLFLFLLFIIYSIFYFKRTI